MDTMTFCLIKRKNMCNDKGMVRNRSHNKQNKLTLKKFINNNPKYCMPYT